MIADIISSINSDALEITLEANPEDITAQRLSVYKDIGITRLSLGVQSFNLRYERLLGRGCSIQQAKKAIHLIQQAEFDSWSLDLMFGLPDQTISELQADLSIILSIRPPHLSLYGLTYEEGTPFTRALAEGKLQDIGEDTWLTMFDQIATSLQQAGYKRYEVSNFCLPEHQAVHNEAIWRNGHYAGLGPGAHGFLHNGYRTHQSPSWDDWLKSSQPDIEIPSVQQHAIDAVLTWIRHRDGIPLEALTQLGFHFSFHRLEPLLSEGYVKREENTILLAKKGWSIVDSITKQLIAGLTPNN